MLCALVAPCVACSSESGEERTEFSFGAPEMQAAAGGDWVGTLTLSGAPETSYQLHLDHAPPANQPACDSRTLVGPECISMSSMGFVGVLSSDDKRFEQAAVTAIFEVMGEDLSSGYLTISATPLSLSASYVDGAFVDGTADEGGTPAGTFTMQRP